MTLVSFDVLTSPKWQMLGWTFSIIEFEKGQKKLLWSSRQRVCQTFRKTTEYFLRYGWSIFVNAVFTALRSVGRPTRFPKDKGFIPIGVSQYIPEGTGSTSPYWYSPLHRGGITQPLNDNISGLTTPEHVSSLDLWVFALCFKALLCSFGVF